MERKDYQGAQRPAPNVQGPAITIRRTAPGAVTGFAAAMVMAAALLVSCQAGAPGASAAPVRKVYFAHTQTYVPYDFVNDKGESDGFEVALLKEVDRILPEYEFELVPTSDDDLLIGIESGKYQGGTKGAWLTEERKKKFLYPAEPSAASVIGLAFRSSDKDKITDLDSFAAYSGKLVPIAPQSAQFALVQDYNTAHPEAPVKLVPSDTFIINDAYAWVLEGRYDGFLDIKLSFEANVNAPDAPYKDLAGKLSWVPWKGIPTWPLFNKQETALAGAWDKAVQTLRADGTLARLSQQYFGEDVFQYVTP